MSLFAIGDLHLSGFKHKPMDIFGDNWENHSEKIAVNWRRVVTDEDTVLIPGDISWAMTMEEVKVDLDFIDALPGKKVFLRGNHDYWWGSVSRLNELYENMYFLQNDVYDYKGIGICGSRGWNLPGSENFDASDMKIYKREQQRCKMSLDTGKRKGFEEIIFMLHYPPGYKNVESGFIDIIYEYNIKKVVFGHLHGELKDFSLDYKGIEFNLVSADQIDFTPVKILD